MALVEITEEFRSQMNFLKMYQKDRENKLNLIDEIKDKLKALQPHVDKYNELADKEKQLTKEIRDDEKFLISMNDMVMRVTGQPISNGELFEQEESND